MLINRVNGKSQFREIIMTGKRLFCVLVLFIVVGANWSCSAVGAGTEPLAFLMSGDFEHMKNIAWRIEEGTENAANPLLEPAMPWDIGGFFSHGTVLFDPIDSMWKAWQISTPLSVPKSDGRTWTCARRLTYLESKDGVKWVRPELSFVPWAGYEKTNILMDVWCSYASVNIKPKKAWPYEMTIFRHEALPWGLYRYRSKDGKKWDRIGEPLELKTNDSCYLYEFSGGKHVAYHKTEMPAFPGGLAPYDIAAGGLRMIGRRTSEDGNTWSHPTELVMTPDWRDPGGTQFMELCPMEYPGGYVALVTVYHNHTQTIDLQWAASWDGINWWRPEP